MRYFLFLDDGTIAATDSLSKKILGLAKTRLVIIDAHLCLEIGPGTNGEWVKIASQPSLFAEAS